jgi:hypothetical protein
MRTIHSNPQPDSLILAAVEFKMGACKSAALMPLDALPANDGPVGPPPAGPFLFGREKESNVASAAFGRSVGGVAQSALRNTTTTRTAE